MSDVFIKRNCKYYDWGSTAPREYGAFCFRKECSIEQANCKECEFTVHELKTLPEYFEPVQKGIKNFEVRKNDRNFKVGDTLMIKEWDGEKFTGRDQSRGIGYILDNPDYVKEGYVILGFETF